MSEQIYWFFSFKDCQRCNGTGWVKIAECQCSRCQRRYIVHLELMVSDCVSLSEAMANGYNQPLLEFVTRTVEERNQS